MDFKEMRARAKRNRRTVPICMRGDLVERFERLERELADAERRELTNPATSIEQESDTGRLAREIEAVRAEMREDTYTWILEALPGKKYRELKAQHPPRQNDEGEVVDDDKILDANYDTFLEPLLRASVVDPALDDADWSEAVDDLSDGQYNTLVNAAVMVNRGGVDVPFSHAASRYLTSTGSE
jgi:hypothetical protein